MRIESSLYLLSEPAISEPSFVVNLAVAAVSLTSLPCVRQTHPLATAVGSATARDA